MASVKLVITSLISVFYHNSELQRSILMVTHSTSFLSGTFKKIIDQHSSVPVPLSKHSLSTSTWWLYAWLAPSGISIVAECSDLVLFNQPLSILHSLNDTLIKHLIKPRHFHYWSEVIPLALNGYGPYANEIGQNKRIEYSSGVLMARGHSHWEVMGMCR